ncbi:MAG: ribosome maturation factor RimP [Firmicutes bacterium]|nr:ribosome maturation factor RimP [Bacillota bacterium]
MNCKIEQLKTALTPVLNSLGLELVDIETSIKFNQQNLTVFIDSVSGITLDDCERAHHAIDPIVDQIDPIDTEFNLNVSSPGLDRPLKSIRDFERNYNKHIEIKFISPQRGKKFIDGILTERTQNSTTITLIPSTKKEKPKQPTTRKQQKLLQSAAAAFDQNQDQQDPQPDQQNPTQIKIENSKISLVRPFVKFE